MLSRFSLGVDSFNVRHGAIGNCKRRLMQVSLFGCRSVS